MVINQGDVFWIGLGVPSGSAPGYRHPHVVVQNNLFNRSRINTVASSENKVFALRFSHSGSNPFSLLLHF